MGSERNTILSALYSLGVLFVSGVMRWILLYWPAISGAAFLALMGWELERTLTAGVAVVILQGTWTLMYVVYMSNREV
jgi:hypothetical protein